MHFIVTYDVHLRDAAAVVYAQADHDTDLGGRRGVGNREEILEGMEKAIREYGIEFYDYYGDVCAPDMSWEEAEEIAAAKIPELS